MRAIQTLMEGYDVRDSQKTQISSTIKTYEKIYNSILLSKQYTKILDYGSGLGHGLKYGKECHYNVVGFEPYYNSDKGVYSPHYSKIGGRLLDNKFDVIISNCILNVLPDDIRAATLKRMWSMLEPWGKIYINVQSLSAIKKSMERGKVLSDSEVLTTRGTYQKGFTNRTLKAYVNKTLPNAIIEKGIGSVSCIVRK